MFAQFTCTGQTVAVAILRMQPRGIGLGISGGYTNHRLAVVAGVVPTQTAAKEALATVGGGAIGGTGKAGVIGTTDTDDGDRCGGWCGC